MMTICVSRMTKGTEIQISSSDLPALRRVYRIVFEASLKVDKCTKLAWHGTVLNGDYSFMLWVPGLDYDLACDRVAELFEGPVNRYPSSLIGG